MISAIETTYSGLRFRSRLEARWAVFFDALGIKWQYEPEGYQLSDGTRYLPDFWLPGFHLFVEVKPPGDSFDKARSFAKESEHGVICAEGEPGRAMALLPHDNCTTCHGSCVVDADGFCITHSCQYALTVGFNTSKGCIWFDPSDEECADFHGAAAAAARVYRFWNPSPIRRGGRQ